MTPATSAEEQLGHATEARRRSGATATGLVWLGAFALLILWVGWRLGGFDLFATVSTPDGPRRVVQTFAAVDHPFHALRAVTLWRSLNDGDLLRWVGHHHGGYPAEFYPLGIAWLEILVAGAAFGTLPLLAVHKLVVICLFVLPVVGYWLLSGGDRLSPAVAFLGLCLHLAIPGEWTHGGYVELVGWGLVTNVGGALAALVAAAATARYVLFGRPWLLPLAAGAGAAAAYVNPRSLLGLAVAGVAIWVSGVLPSTALGHDRRPLAVTARLGLAALAALLLAAPELVALVRFRDLYRFLHYQAYETLRAYWDASQLAVSPPVFAAGVLGGVWALVSIRYPVARAVALTAIGYAMLTVFLSTGGEEGPIQQLEAPRLMPFQRYLTIYLAAFGVVRLLDAASRLERWRGLAPVAACMLGIAAVAATVVPLRGVPAAYHTFAAVEETGTPEFDQFRDAVQRADAAAPTGTAILVVGSRLSWHEQLWAPLDTDRPLYYDDWLWYWHDRHDGPYAFAQGHHYPSPAAAFTRAYFDTHSIGAVVVTDRLATGEDEQEAAREVRELMPVASGVWDVYRVDRPLTLATVGGQPADQIDVSAHRIEATFSLTQGGELVVRQNWFPRWEATLNGASAPVARRDDGYMSIQVPSGPVELSLSYAVQPLDWLARLAALVGALVAVTPLVRARRRRRQTASFVASAGG